MNASGPIDELAIRRGDDAARVIDNPAVKAAFASMREEIIAQWSAAPARDAESREWIWRHYKVLEKFEGILRGFMETGRMEKIRRDSVDTASSDKARAIVNKFKAWAK